MIYLSFNHYLLQVYSLTESLPYFYRFLSIYIKLCCVCVSVTGHFLRISYFSAGFWESGNFGKWDFGELGFWGSGILGKWDFERVGFWKSWILGKRHFGKVGF